MLANAICKQSHFQHCKRHTMQLEHNNTATGWSINSDLLDGVNSSGVLQPGEIGVMSLRLGG